MNDGVVVVDETGRIFYANPSYVSILGVPLRRIMGKQIQDVEPGVPSEPGRQGAGSPDQRTAGGGVY